MKKVWITGGGSGIGAALALKMAKEGSKVFISGRKQEALDEVAEKHEKITSVNCDITDQDSVKNAIEQIGDIDIAVLNAGTYTPGPTSKATLEDFHFCMEVNYFGTINCVDALLGNMQSRGKGHIALVASVAGYMGLPNASGYGPSKAALISYAESLWAELYDGPVKIQLVNPGFVKSKLTSKNDFEMPYLMEAEDAAKEIITGLKSSDFEIAFPKPFVRRMKLLKFFPYGSYFKMIRKATGLS